MLRAPSWITSATSQHGLEVARVHQLGDDRQPGLGLGLGEQAQPLLPEALERVGRGARLVGAAAEQARAAGARRCAPRSASGRATRPCTARRSARSARRRSGGPSISTTVRSPGLSCAEDSLNGLRIGTTCSTPVVALEAEAGDVLAVADRADHRHLLAARGMGASAAGLDPGDDGLDLLLGGRRLHHDHHGLSSPGCSQTIRWDGGWRGARPGGPMSGRPRRDASAGRAPS